MKKLLISLTVVLIIVVGCGEKGGSGGNQSGIQKAIIGAWEIDTLSYNGQSMKPDRPDPQNPYANRSLSQWTQLSIDEATLTIIMTDFIHVSTLKLPYKIEDKKIITIDEENISMTDFVVHSFSNNSLTLEFISEDNTPQGMKYIFRRINGDSLATKTAQSLNFEQNIRVNIGRTDLPALALDKTTVGQIDDEINGLHDSISCSLNNEGKLRLNYRILEVDGNSIRSDSSRDRASIFFNGFELDLEGPQKYLNSNSAAIIEVKTEQGLFTEDVTNCSHDINRNGAALQIATSCTSNNGEENITIEATCLLYRFYR